MDVRRNQNPLLPKAPSPTENARHEPFSPTEGGGQAMANSSATSDAADQDSGRAMHEGEKVGEHSHVERIHQGEMVLVETPQDRAIPRGQQSRQGQERARQRPKAAEEEHGSATGTCEGRSSENRLGSIFALAKGARTRRRTPTHSLTIATPGHTSDRGETRPWSPPYASPGVNETARPGGRRPTTAPAWRGMAASPEGTFLLHRLRGLETTQRLSARLPLSSPTSPTCQGALRPRTARSPGSSERAGDAPVCRVRPGPAGVNLFPWGVSPDSPRGRLIVHQSRLPYSKHDL